LQNWSWETTGGVFRFQNPIWRLDFPMKRLCFRFSCEMLGLSLARHFFGPIEVSKRKNLGAQINGQKPLGKPTKHATPSKKPDSSSANSDKLLHSFPLELQP
jgi:hypothetical protein